MKKILLMTMAFCSTQLFANIDMDAELYSYSRISNSNVYVNDACLDIYQNSEAMKDKIWNLYQIDKKISVQMQSVLRNNINAAYHIDLNESANMTFNEICRKLDKATKDAEALLETFLDLNINKDLK